MNTIRTHHLPVLSRSLSTALLAIVLVFSGAPFTKAATFIWNSSSNAFVLDSANWSPVPITDPSGVPGSGDTAQFGTINGAASVSGTWNIQNIEKTAGGTQIITGPGAPASGVVTVSGNLTHSSLNTTMTIRNGSGQLSVEVQGAFSLTNGSRVRLGDGATVSTGAGSTGSEIENFNVTGSGTTNVAAGSTIYVSRVGGTINLGALTLNGTLNPISGFIDGTRGTTDGATNAITVGSLSGNGTITGNKVGATLTTTGVIEVNGSSSTTFSGTISNGLTNNVVALTKNGSSTLTLNGTNTYTGNTTVSAGTLLVNSSLAAGSAVTVSGTGTLGGSGTVNGSTTVGSGATLLGGIGNVATDLTLADDLSFASGSIISLALGAPGANSSLIRSGSGAWAFQADQQFSFLDLGVSTGTYSGLITGLASDPGVSSWQILNSGWSGTFSYNSGSVDLNVSAIPEPSTWALLTVSLTVMMIFRRRRSNHS